MQRGHGRLPTQLATFFCPQSTYNAPLTAWGAPNPSPRACRSNLPRFPPQIQMSHARLPITPDDFLDPLHGICHTFVPFSGTMTFLLAISVALSLRGVFSLPAASENAASRFMTPRLGQAELVSHDLDGLCAGVRVWRRRAWTLVDSARFCCSEL
jgi:hypothetical protein